MQNIKGKGHYAMNQGHIVTGLGFREEPSADGYTITFVDKEGKATVIENIDDETGGSVARETGEALLGGIPLDTTYRFDQYGDLHGITVKHETIGYQKMPADSGEVVPVRYPAHHEYYWHGEPMNPIAYYMRSGKEFLMHSLKLAKAIMIDDTVKDAKNAARYVQHGFLQDLKLSAAILSGRNAVEKFFNNKRDVGSKAERDVSLSSNNLMKPNSL